MTPSHALVRLAEDPVVPDRWYALCNCGSAGMALTAEGAARSWATHVELAWRQALALALARRDGDERIEAMQHRNVLELELDAYHAARGGYRSGQAAAAARRAELAS